MLNNKTIIITGSSGFIGSYLVSHFAESGYLVRAFQRKNTGGSGDRIRHYPFELSDIHDQGFQGADYLIHCAYQPVSNRIKADINIESAKKIISLSRKYGIKLIFLSSMSAHPDAESMYGKHKLRIEELLDEKKDLILKPGFVMGRGGGLFGRIAGIIENNPIIPLVGGSRRIQTIALDDLARLIEAGIEKQLTGKFLLAHPTAVRMKELNKQLAVYARRKPLFIPIPISAAYALLSLAEKIGFRLAITSENALGLKNLKIFDTAPDLRTFGLPIKDYKATLKKQFFY